MFLLLLLLPLCSSVLAESSTIIVGGFDSKSSEGGIYDTVEIITDTGVCADKVPAFPFARSGLALATYNSGDLVVCGGENRGPSTSNFNACYFFWGQEGRWIEGPPTIYGRDRAHIHSLDSIESKVVIFGGVRDMSGGGTVLEQLNFGFDNEWEEKPEWSLPQGTIGACSVLLPADTGYGPRYIHLLGGQWDGTSEPSHSHYRLDAWYGTGWQEMPDMMEARDNFGCVATSQGIFVTGGQDAAHDYKTSVEFYSFLMAMWEPMEGLEHP